MLVRVFRISQVFALLFAACAACASGAPNKRPQLDLRAEKIEIIAPKNSTEDEIFAAQLLRSELSNILDFNLRADTPRRRPQVELFIGEKRAVSDLPGAAGDGLSDGAVSNSHLSENCGSLRGLNGREIVKKARGGVFAGSVRGGVFVGSVRGGFLGSFAKQGKCGRIRIYLQNSGALEGSGGIVSAMDSAVFEVVVGVGSIRIIYPAPWKAPQAVGIFLRKYCKAVYYTPDDSDYRKSSLVFKRGIRRFKPPFLSAVIFGREEEHRWLSLNGFDLRSPYMKFSHNLSSIFSGEVCKSFPQTISVSASGRPDSSAQPNFSNYISADIAAAAAARAFEKSAAMFSIGIKDTQQVDCSASSAKFKRGYFRGYADWSNAVFEFSNRVANKVGEKYPGGLLGCLAYLICTNAPDFKLHENLVPFVATDRGNYFDADFHRQDFLLLKKWGECGSQTFGIYDYLYGSPYLFPREISEYVHAGISAAHDFNARLYFAEANPIWGFDAFKMNVVARTIENPDIDFNALKGEFFSSYYGRAAAKMAEFFGLARGALDSRRDSPHWLRLFKAENSIMLYDESRIEKMQAALSEAAELAYSDKNPAVRARVGETARAFELTKKASALGKAKISLWRNCLKTAASPENRDNLMRAFCDYLKLRSDFLTYIDNLAAIWPNAAGYKLYGREIYAPVDFALGLLGDFSARNLPADFAGAFVAAKKASEVKEWEFAWQNSYWADFKKQFQIIEYDWQCEKLTPTNSGLLFENCQLTGISKIFDVKNGQCVDFSGRVDNVSSPGTMCYASLLFLGRDNFVVDRKTLVFPSGKNIDFKLLGIANDGVIKVVASVFATRQSRGQKLLLKEFDVKIGR